MNESPLYLETSTARMTLLADSVRIESTNPAKPTSDIPIASIRRVYLQHPWQSEAANRNGYIHFVTDPGEQTETALALQHGKPNVVAIPALNLDAAIRFTHAVERRVAKQRKHDEEPIPATLGKPTLPPLPKPPAIQAATSVPARSYSAPPATISFPSMSQLPHLRTIAAGVVILASLLAFSFWFSFCIGFMTAANPPEPSDFAEGDPFSTGRIWLAFFGATALTFMTWVTAERVVGND